MEEEIWKDIKGYESLYQVSSFGRIKSLERYIIYNNRWGSTNSIKLSEKILKYQLNNKGYCMIILYKKGRGYHKLIHRLVAETFLSNPNNLPEVNHEDENKLNNKVSNLKWCDRMYNNNYGGQSKEGRRKSSEWRMKKVAQYTREGLLVNTYNGIRIAEEKTKINNQGICKCCKGKQKTAGGFVWRYINE